MLKQERNEPACAVSMSTLVKSVDYVCTRMCVYVRACVRVCMRVCVCVHVRVCACACVYLKLVCRRANVLVQWDTKSARTCGFRQARLGLGMCTLCHQPLACLHKYWLCTTQACRKKGLGRQRKVVLMSLWHLHAGVRHHSVPFFLTGLPELTKRLGMAGHPSRPEGQ